MQDNVLMTLNRTSNTDDLTQIEQPELLLSVHNAKDRELIKKFLPDFFTIEISENGLADHSFDLCILDHQSFEANKQKLKELKNQATPIFLPFLLLSPNEKTARTSTTVLEFADDVVYIPASKKLLQSRIKMLLKQREYSLELKEKNQELEEKNEQLSIYEQALNSTNVGVTITDINQDDNPIVFCNEGFKELTGYSEEEILGRNCRFLQNDDRDQDVLEKIRSLIKNREKGTVRLRNYGKDGSLFWNDLSIAPIKSKKGEINYFVGIQRDVTELVKIQQKLQEEKEQYQLITENSTDMISRHAPDGTYLYVSPAVKELTGYDPEDLLGHKPFENMHSGDRKIFENPEELFADKKVKRFTFRKRTNDGYYKWVESIMRPIVDDETGEVTEIQASTRDISDRKEFQKKLKEEKEFIDKAIQSLPELFLMIDEDENFIKWNNVEWVLGYTDEEMRDMYPVDLVREEDQEFITNKIREVFETGFAEAEVQMKSKSGELIPHLVTARKFSRGDSEFIVGTGINLSEIKEVQYDLEQKQRLLDAVINQSKSLIYVKDQDRKYRLVNDSYVNIFDKSREDILGKSVREVHGREFERQVEKNDDAVLKDGKTVETEEAIPVHGEIRYYHSIKYPLEGVPGFENCMCGISTDITDLKLATNKLQERIKEQRCLYNISSLPQQEDTVEGLLEKAVSYLTEGLRYPESAEAAITYGDDIYKTDGYRETELQLSAESGRGEGKILQVQVVYTEEKPRIDEGPFLDEERQLIDSVADTLSSQIDRIISAERLKESKNRWEKLVKNDPDLIAIVVDRQIKFINQSGAQILGADSPEEVTGKNLDEIVKADDMELVEERERKLMSINTLDPFVHSLEPVIHKIKAMDGKIRHIKTQSTPITYEGDQRAIQIVGQDVTDQIAYERELKESLREKETLLQEIHHRVKNNLAVVSGMMDLQAFSTENEEVKRLLNDSRNRIKTMALIHEKLYQSASLSQIDFGSYVEDLIENIKGVSASDKEIEVELEYDSFNLNVNQAVPCALIINEVVANAFEHAFTDRESGLIKVTLKHLEDNIVVSVKDNGRGLPSDFEYRKSQSIGTTIIETLIQQLEAEKKVESQNGFSFTFTFKKKDIKGSSSTLV